MRVPTVGLQEQLLSEPREVLEPVELLLVRECHFKAKSDGRRGCERCERAKKDRAHMGAPPSLNLLGSGNPHAYQGLKQQWEGVLGELLLDSGLPKGVGHVLAEGEATFPDRGRRDQGNYRALLEKALGDVLVSGGWLEDDDWTRFEFGGLAYRYERGVSATRLMLFPSR